MIDYLVLKHSVMCYLYDVLVFIDILMSEIDARTFTYMYIVIKHTH